MNYPNDPTALAWITQGRQSHYLPTLDGWRGIAIGVVLTGHSTVSLLPRFVDENHLPIYLRAELGVNLFFALSGFLITLLIQRDKDGGHWLTRFWTRRVFRIVPTCWFFLLVMLGLTMAGLAAVPSSVLADGFGFRMNISERWNDPGAYPVAHLWSLGLEMQFYVVWPLCLAVTRRKYVCLMALLFLGICALWRYYDYRHTTFADTLFEGAAYYWRPDIRLDSFVGGCLAAGLSERFGAVLLRRYYPALLIPVLGVCYLACAMYAPPLTLSLEPALLGLLILGTLIHCESRFALWLEWAPLKWLGRVSFSLYIWQQLFLMPATKGRTLGILQEGPWSYLAILAATILSYRYIEMPSAAAGSRLARRI